MLKLITWLRPFSGYVLALTAILIMTVSSIPSIPTLKVHAGGSEIRLDYLIHFCEYGFLSFLAFLTFAGRNFSLSLKKYVLTAFAVVCFAAVDEFHQKLIPGRSFNPRDLISNLSGIAGGLIFCLFSFRLIRKRLFH